MLSGSLVTTAVEAGACECVGHGVACRQPTMDVLTTWRLGRKLIASHRKKVGCYEMVHSTSCCFRWPRGLRRRSWPLGYWNRGFKSRSKHGCLSLCFCVVLRR
jgi:hypothetical protein